MHEINSLSCATTSPKLGLSRPSASSIKTFIEILLLLIPPTLYLSRMSDAAQKMDRLVPEFFEQLQMTIHLPADEEYKESLSSYFSNQESNIRPAYVLRPKNSGEVAKAVSLLVKANKHAGIGAVKFAVRSGGHACVAGSANIADGITIDLRGLDSIQVAEDSASVAVGCGASWGEVYRTLGSLGLAVAGGRQSPIGVGGLTLGGNKRNSTTSRTAHTSRWFIALLWGGRLGLRHCSRVRNSPRERRATSSPRRQRQTPGFIPGPSGRFQQLWHRHSFRVQDLPTRASLCRNGDAPNGDEARAAADVLQLLHHIPHRSASFADADIWSKRGTRHGMRQQHGPHEGSIRRRRAKAIHGPAACIHEHHEGNQSGRFYSRAGRVQCSWTLVRNPCAITEN